jgi:hypothetical protein
VSDVQLVRKLNLAEERRRIAKVDSGFQNRQAQRWLIDRALSWIFLRLIFGRVPNHVPYGRVFDRWIAENSEPDDEFWEYSEQYGVDLFIGYAIVRKGEPIAKLWHTQALIEQVETAQ